MQPNRKMENLRIIERSGAIPKRINCLKLFSSQAITF